MWLYFGLQLLMLVDWLSLNKKHILQSNSWDNLYLNWTGEILQNIIFTRLVDTKPDNETCLKAIWNRLSCCMFLPASDETALGYLSWNSGDKHEILKRYKEEENYFCNLSEFCDDVTWGYNKNKITSIRGRNSWCRKYFICR